VGASRAGGGSRVGGRSGAEREEEGRGRGRKGKRNRKWRKENEKKGKRGGEKEKKGRRVGADRGNRSRVADRRSSGAGWDTSEERERITSSGKRNDGGNWMSGQRNKI
jgi:hypothetical protein